MLADEFLVGQELDAVDSLLEHLREVFLRVRSVVEPSARARHEEHGERFEAPLPLDLRRGLKRNAVGILECAVPEDGRPRFGLLIRVGRDDERL